MNGYNACTEQANRHKNKRISSNFVVKSKIYIKHNAIMHLTSYLPQLHKAINPHKRNTTIFSLRGGQQTNKTWSRWVQQSSLTLFPQFDLARRIRIGRPRAHQSPPELNPSESQISLKKEKKKKKNPPNSPNSESKPLFPLSPPRRICLRLRLVAAPPNPSPARRVPHRRRERRE